MDSLVRRSGRLFLAASALALAISILPGSSAMAQHGGHGGGGGAMVAGHIGGMGHSGGMRHHGFRGLGGGYGFYPGSYGVGYGGYGLGYGGYGLGYGYVDPFYGGYATGYGYPTYGYDTTYSDTGFLAPALSFGP